MHKKIGKEKTDRFLYRFLVDRNIELSDLKKGFIEVLVYLGIE